MAIPLSLFPGDRVKWIDANVPDGATAVSVWFRTNTAGAGVEAVGALNSDGEWELVLEGAVTAAMVSGEWAWQAIAVLPTGTTTYDSGRIKVLVSFAFSGTPGAVDLRSQAEKDLAEVEEAIRVLSSGAQSYTIGTVAGGRTFSRPQLAQLIAWRDRLIQQVSAEQIANGTTRRNRRILVQFD